MCKLTAKQQRFVDEYLIDFNGTQAAIRAGYSVNAAAEQAARLLTIANIKNAISTEQAKTAAKLALTREKVANEYKRLAFSNITDVVDWINVEPGTQVGETEDGTPIINYTGGITIIAKNSTDLTERQKASIAEISIDQNGKLKIKQHDKKGALDSLCKMLGFNEPEKQNVELTINSHEQALAELE